VIAFHKSPRETGILVCRTCHLPRHLKDFEPRTDSRYGVRRQCRECRQPTKQQYESKRPALKLERRIATAEGPELEALAADVLNSNDLRSIQALTCRLEAGTYKRDARGRPIIPPTLKARVGRLGRHRAVVFCRRQLGLPPLPAQRRVFGAASAERRFCFAVLREIPKQIKAEIQAKKQAEQVERQRVLRGHGPRKHWAPDRRPEPSRTIDEMERDRIMAMPPPASLLADASSRPTWTTPPIPTSSPSHHGTQTLEDVRGAAVCSNPPLDLRPPIADASTRKPALPLPAFWGPAPGSPEDTAALKAAGLPPRRIDPTPEPSPQAERQDVCRDTDVTTRPLTTKDEVHAALAAGRINDSKAAFLLDSIDLSAGRGRQLRVL
jgi:hypothetical protein